VAAGPHPGAHPGPHWKVRPYVLTQGRAYTRQRLYVHTLVSAPDYEPRFAATLPPETRRLYDLARTVTSVAELSAFAGLPLGVTRVVIDDLAAGNRLRVHEQMYESPFDTSLLERLRDGLRQLA
jgi:hypothetical protein